MLSRTGWELLQSTQRSPAQPSPAWPFAALHWGCMAGVAAWSSRTGSTLSVCKLCLSLPVLLPWRQNSAECFTLTRNSLLYLVTGVLYSSPGLWPGCVVLEGRAVGWWPLVTSSAVSAALPAPLPLWEGVGLQGSNCSWFTSPMAFWWLCHSVWASLLSAVCPGCHGPVAEQHVVHLTSPSPLLSCFCCLLPRALVLRNRFPASVIAHEGNVIWVREGSPFVGVPSRAGRVRRGFARPRHVRELWIVYLKLWSCCENLARVQSVQHSLLPCNYFLKPHLQNTAKRGAKAPPAMQARKRLHCTRALGVWILSRLSSCLLLYWSGSGMELWNICNNNNNFQDWEEGRDEKSHLPSPLPEQ